MGLSFRLLKRLLAVASGMVITWIGSSSAYALNQFFYVGSCSNCQTTTDFIAAAKSTARGVESSGVYQIISTAAPRTAYIQITGQYSVGPTGETRFIPSSAIPIDSAGNSLAGLPESQLQAEYIAIDIIISGTQRNNPIFWTVLQGMPSNWGASTDAQIEAALMGNPPDIVAAFEKEDGQVVEVTFGTGSSQVKADYEVTVLYNLDGTLNKIHLEWTGKATDSQGQPLNRDGSRKVNQNQSGTGGGSVSVPGFGPGQDWIWTFTGFNLCTYGGSVEFPGVPAITSFGFGPC